MATETENNTLPREMVISLKDIPYCASSHPRHRLNLYIPQPVSTSTNPLLIFIHGGAWRTNNREEYEGLGIRLATVTGCTVAIPSYRLSLPADDPNRPQHPSHVMDIEAAIRFLHLAAPSYGYDARNIHLIGHSAGAHIAALLVNGNYLTQQPNILPSIHTVIDVDGIYDLPGLVEEYVDYECFIAQAFGSDKTTWIQASATASTSKTADSHPYDGKWVIVHSVDDELLSLRQSKCMIQWLTLHWLTKDRQLLHDFTSVTGKHDELLNDDNIVKYIHRIIQN